jgi:hypothetical protein
LASSLAAKAEQIALKSSDDTPGTGSSLACALKTTKQPNLTAKTNFPNNSVQPMTARHFTWNQTCHLEESTVSSPFCWTSREEKLTQNKYFLVIKIK